MIKPENSRDIGYVYDPNDLTQVYRFGDFLRKTSLLLNDSEEKWKLASKAEEIQTTEWPSVQSYHKELKKVEKNLADHIATHEDPFTIR